MVKKSFVRKFREDFRKNKQQYDTAGGTYTSDYDVKINFTMPEFSASKIINQRFHVDNEEEDMNIGYDMIIGRDLMTKLGLITDYKRKVLTWDDISVPMRSAYHTDSKPTFSRAEIRQIMTQTAEPIATQEATERIVKILDSKYEKADLDEVAANAEQLNKPQQRKLLSLLKDFEDLFDGTLGHWETEPIDIELKPDHKPSSARYYPVPRINKATFKKELLRLVDIGVLTPVQQSEYGTPVFIIPKKEGTVRFLTDYRRINQGIVRKPYPIPRISETLQQMEGFQFATALDLNMGY